MDKIKGLTQAEVIRSRSIHGENCLVKEKRVGIARKLLENLNDPIPISKDCILGRYKY